MFMNFFSELRQAKVPVTLKEYLMLMEALDRDVIDKSVDDFYFLSRAALVKDEKHLDRFDQVFGHVFKGLEKVTIGMPMDVQAEWLKALSDKFLSDEDRKMIEEMGGFEKLMELLAERMRAAKERGEDGDEDGKKGRRGKDGRHFSSAKPTATTPKASASGQDKGRHYGKGDQGLGQARVQGILDDSRWNFGTCATIKVALQRLRKFARLTARRTSTRHQGHHQGDGQQWAIST